MTRRFCYYVHRLALALGAGLLCQVGPCGLTNANAEDLQRLAGQWAQLATREASIVISDAVFFFLDNLLVRMTG
jgi:hypothetical protein